MVRVGRVNTASFSRKRSRANMKAGNMNWICNEEEDTASTSFLPDMFSLQNRENTSFNRFILLFVDLNCPGLTTVRQSLIVFAEK